jgi:hypothetical protein
MINKCEPQTTDMMDFNKVKFRNKRNSQHLVMKNMLGRDEKRFQVTDEYKNIHLENTREEREEEFEEKKRERHYRIKLLEYCK